MAKVFLDIQIGSRAVGRMTFELFSSTVPKTCENFRALCTGERGIGKISKKPLHFKFSTFHRIIRGFMAQGGDFTLANGLGGESIYGESFPDENFIHKHSQRGLLSMANSGEDTNGSQFFVTFRAVPHLDGKHVVFGRMIDGNNVLDAMERTRTGRKDRPQEKIMISNCGEVTPELEAKAKANEAQAKEEEEEEEEGPPPPSNMNARQRKLYEMKQRFNKLRTANVKAVREEHSRLNEDKKSSKGRRQQWLERQEQRRQRILEAGGNPDQPMMHETSEAVESRQKRKRKGRDEAFGWAVYNQETLYNAHKKRVKRANIAIQDVGAPTTTAPVTGDGYTEEGVERMVKELEQAQARRSRFSRRRPFYEEQDVAHINERNRMFNKKVSRAFDKYTMEIKQNLERGTAR